MRHINKSSYIFLTAIFVFSFESAAMLRAAARIAPPRVSHLPQMASYCTNAKPQLGAKQVIEFYSLINKQHKNMIGSSEIKELLQHPSKDNLLEIYYRAAITGQNDLAVLALISTLRLGFKINSQIECNYNIDTYNSLLIYSVLEFALDNNLAMAKILFRDFKANPNINTASHVNKYQPLWAKYIDNPEVLELLIKYGVDNLFTKGNKSLLVSLYEHASNGSESAEKYMILLRRLDRNGCKLNEADKQHILKNSGYFFEEQGLVNILNNAGKKWEAGEENIVKAIGKYRSNELNFREFFNKIKPKNETERE